MATWNCRGPGPGLKLKMPIASSTASTAPKNLAASGGSGWYPLFNRSWTVSRHGVESAPAGHLPARNPPNDRAGRGLPPYSRNLVIACAGRQRGYDLPRRPLPPLVLAAIHHRITRRTVTCHNRRPMSPPPFDVPPRIGSSRSYGESNRAVPPQLRRRRQGNVVGGMTSPRRLRQRAIVQRLGHVLEQCKAAAAAERHSRGHLALVAFGHHHVAIAFRKRHGDHLDPRLHILSAKFPAAASP